MLKMDIIEFINRLKINYDMIKSNNILFYLSKFGLHNFNIYLIVRKPLNKYFRGGGHEKKIIWKNLYLMIRNL